ncbi:MAG: replication-associated recombination protein A [Deltaproteobacteria bacterium]|nr:replication-associated recombination protein A [Deltaproteobacteria bacterium]
MVTAKRWSARDVDLFEYNAKVNMAGDAPLADRMRPRTLDDFIGQGEAVGEGSLIRQAIATQRLFSMILWGPPGCGKTTLARLIARASQARFVEFSAVLSGVKDIRQVIQEARQQRDHHHRRTLLFVDEIHRFNKAQQDAFLHHVETGLITLIGATTENPSFEVIPALLSRCRVVVLTPHSPETLAKIVDAALSDAERGLGKWNCRMAPEAMDFLVRIADGDARTVLNNLEMAVALHTSQNERLPDAAPACIQLKDVETVLQKKALRYDKSGDEHFNLISALHKSLRGSDPDAALYWLARMLAAGEDPLYIARRMVRFASEDIGIADPQALTIALNGMEAFRFLGAPEGELAMAQVAIYLATAPKSNAVYTAYKGVQEDIRRHGTLPVPLHIRNAPTELMKDLGYGANYRYAHDYEDAFVAQQYLPREIRTHRYYHPTERGYEKTVKKLLDRWRRLTQKTGLPDSRQDPEDA